MSPTAKTSGCEARRCSSMTTPLAVSRPASSASAVLGVAPTPTTPAVRAAAATSSPIQPPQMMARRFPCCSADLRRWLSSIVRKAGDRRAAVVGDQKSTRRGPGGEQQPVVADALLVGGHGVSVHVEPGDGCPEPQVDLVLVVPARGMHERRLELLGAEQEALGQRWAFVGQVGLGAAQNERPSKPPPRKPSAAFAAAMPAPTITNVSITPPCDCESGRGTPRVRTGSRAASRTGWS